MATAYHTATDELATLAQALIDGGQHPFGTGAYFTFEDWRSAAETWWDTRDTSELAFMFDREHRWEDFRNWQSCWRSREDVGFDEWLSARPAESYVPQVAS